MKTAICTVIIGLLITLFITVFVYNTPSVDKPGLEVVAEFNLPSDMLFEDVPFGGISGLDRLGTTNQYVLFRMTALRREARAFIVLIFTLNERISSVWRSKMR